MPGRFQSIGRMIWLPIIGVLTLGVLALPYTATQLLRSLQAHRPIRDPGELDGVGAIVVLGGDFVGYAPEMGGDTVGPLTLQRLHYAARLHRDSGLPLLLTGGVIGRNNRSLAESMAQVLDQDFNRTARWVDGGARSTRENARNSRASLQPHGIRKICLVTHGWHMVRATRAFVEEGFDVVAAPTLCLKKPSPIVRDFFPSATALSRSLVALREWCARGWYVTSACREKAWRRVRPLDDFEPGEAYAATSSFPTSRMNAITRSSPGSDA